MDREEMHSIENSQETYSQSDCPTECRDGSHGLTRLCCLSGNSVQSG